MNNRDEQEELKGSIAVQLANNLSLDDLCMEHILDYNRDRFEAFAVRVFLGDETIITIYAVDKIRQEDESAKVDKLPVKKFKLTDLPVTALFSYCSGFNFTLSTGNYDIEDMEVVNK